MRKVILVAKSAAIMIAQIQARSRMNPSKAIGHGKGVKMIRANKNWESERISWRSGEKVPLGMINGK